ncbi:Flp family type IVb pilin [Salinibacillus xinjiangensis]|uniref:Flp family type IVb pilin n=1 Tax=Salinibacillus xinjiangensis TaxID=1229268 RepID=A0A6G1X4D5_9BACI|nr:Flp family type IVb pilin [Salinibacillus xinjiangensis]MRG85807.1 Flp family type IVb pilin [Salinibacillus xinjiangensis]
MKNLIQKLVKEEKGQGMTEYGLILGLIALAAVGIMVTVGDEIVKKFEDVVNKFRTPGDGAEPTTTTSGS